jgi:tRNA1(Val) A37 N6-methylase TrmN6
MKELLRTTDLVRLSWLTALLADQQIQAFVLDTHTSVLEGSANAIPRRLLVSDHDYEAATRLFAEAGSMEKHERQPDSLLDGKVNLCQPANGYRAAIDPVLLASATPAVKGRVLDVGAGVGAAALCYATRVPGACLTGLELQSELSAIAEENAIRNDLVDRVTFVQGDLLRPPETIVQSSFDHVMTNPPYLPPDRGQAPPDPSKAIAMIEGEADLSAWIEFCIAMVKPKGSITMVHRADRLDELLALFHDRVGGIVVAPVWPGGNRPAKRVIVRARRDVRTPLRLTTGLTLHSNLGGYTEEALAILRDGKAMVM